MNFCGFYCNDVEKLVNHKLIKELCVKFVNESPALSKKINFISYNSSLLIYIRNSQLCILEITAKKNSYEILAQGVYQCITAIFRLFSLSVK